MAGGFAAHLPVGGIVQLAAAVATGGLHNPGQILQVMLEAPEATASEHGGFRFRQNRGRHQHQGQGQQSDQHHLHKPLHPCT